MRQVLCAVGAVALAEIVWSDDARDGSQERWSGLFSGGSSGGGLLRLSSAAAPPFAPGSVAGSVPALGLVAGSLRQANLFPCAAFKVPRSGAPSGNLLFMGRKTGQARSPLLSA